MKNVLFLCTGNTARSIMFEAVLRRDGAGRFRAFSAGSHPKGTINPHALAAIETHGYRSDGLRSKSWDEFAAPGAPTMDIVITACDAAAGEACPLWPGAPVKAHWGLPDPAAAPESDAGAAFEAAFHHIRSRVAALLALSNERIESPGFAADLATIGDLPGRSSGPAM